MQLHINNIVTQLHLHGLNLMQSVYCACTQSKTLTVCWRWYNFIYMTADCEWYHCPIEGKETLWQKHMLFMQVYCVVMHEHLCRWQRLFVDLLSWRALIVLLASARLCSPKYATWLIWWWAYSDSGKLTAFKPCISKYHKILCQYKWFILIQEHIAPYILSCLCTACGQSPWGTKTQPMKVVTLQKMLWHICKSNAKYSAQT